MTEKQSASAGQRQLFTKVKTAKGRKISSTLWLQRQLNDPYIAKSKLDGYRSRSAYKLVELNEKFHFLTKDSIVIDLGAAPGGWSQVAANIIGSSHHGRVIALDLKPMDPLPGVIDLCCDFTEEEALEQLNNALKGSKADFILSDMAPNTTGHKNTDHLRIMGLCEEVFIFATQTLKPGGGMLIKLFQGGAQDSLLQQIKTHFATTKHVKPPSSRKKSSELYLIALGFKG